MEAYVHFRGQAHASTYIQGRNVVQPSAQEKGVELMATQFG